MLILFYDGECGLCSRSVRWVHRIDRLRAIAFAPLQGETARRILSEKDRTEMDSMLLVEGDQVWRKSAAIMQLIRATDCRWYKGVLFFDLFPQNLLDWLYDRVARNRDRFFSDFCSIEKGNPEIKVLP